MKPRQLTVSIETTTDVAFDALRKARGGIVAVYDATKDYICELAVEQIQINVIRQPRVLKGSGFKKR